MNAGGTPAFPLAIRNCFSRFAGVVTTGNVDHVKRLRHYGMIVAAGMFCGELFAETPQTPRAVVLREALEATVEVLVDGKLKGGGAFVSADGLVITAAHVFGSRDARFEVISAALGRYPAELLAFDKGHDIALLRVVREPAGESKIEDKKFPVLGVAKRIPPLGSPVYNLSMALRNRGVLMHGMVAQEETVFNELADSNGYMEHYFVSAMTPSLTSGGVWINGRGEIVGVQSARLNDGKLKSGVAMVAPPKAVAGLIKTRQSPATPGMGGWVWEVWTTDAEFLQRIPPDTEGLVITWLRDGGPLKRAGLERLDVILACDGKKVVRRPDLLRLVRKKKPGQKIRLTILKPDTEGTRKVAVELENLEEIWAKGK